MKEVKRIRIDEGALGYLMALHFEMDGLRVLNAQLIRSGDNQGETYQRYLAEYKAARTAWGMAFHETVKALEPGGGLNDTYKIDFITGELVVLQRGESGV